MNYSRFFLIFSLLAASPAFAASVVMVQFGSFETQDEANKRLTDIKSTNSAALGNLPTSVREVKLPPDNLTVYRTQAGPLASRADAQSLCGKLAANGSECYVVETAVTQTAPATKVETASAPIPPAPAPAASAPAGKTAAATATPDAKALNTASTASTPLAPSVNSVRIPEISRSSANVSSSGNTAPVVTNTPPSSPQLQSAMDKAVAAQNAGTVATADNTTVIEPAAPKRSFWSRMNPFSSDEKPAPAPKPMLASAPMPVAAPVEPISSSSLAPTGVALAPLAPAAAGSKATPESVLKSTPITTAAAKSIEPVKPMTSDTAIVLPSSAPQVASNNARPQLLPPPAPLTAQDKQILENPVVRPEPEVLSGPIGGKQTPVVKAESTPALIIRSTPLTPGDGNVKVEEAKRVPVTETVAAPAAPAPVAAAPAVPAVNLLPSSTTGTKTLWAQIGQFSDSEQALTFWENYRQTHPDFPVVRVRVASSIQQQEHGNDRVWLRVGPFARDGFINSLCTSLANNENKDIQSKRCGVVTDMGIAAKSGSTPSGYLQGSRYKR